MVDMLKKLVSNTFVHVFIVAFAAVAAFWPTLQMFFYLDEWGALYDFTHGDYNYTIFTTRNFYLLYWLFGLNATGYFAVGIAIYTLSVVGFYFFVSHLLKNKMLGLVAGLLYATTPVGSSTVIMIWTYIAEGGYPLTVMLLVLLYLFLMYIRQKRIPYFLLVALGFLFFLELEPRRVFMFLPILTLFDYCVAKQNNHKVPRRGGGSSYVKNFKELIPTPGFLTRQLILFASFIAYYKYDISLSKLATTGRIAIAESSYDWRTKLDLGISSPTHLKPLVTLTNVLLGGPWVFLTERLTGYVDLADIKQMYLLVAITLSIAFALVIIGWKVKREWGLLAFFSLGWIHINILGIYIFSSPGVSDTTHRTLSLAAPAYALFFTISGLSLYTSLKKRKTIKSAKYLNRIFFVALFLLVSVNFMATHYNFNKFNAFHGRPARAFFKNLKTFYPTLPQNSLIYIETPKSPQLKYQLSRIYGGSPYGVGASIAVFYPEVKKEEITLVHNYQDVGEFVGGNLSKIDHVFAFYYDENGLQDRTTKIREELKQKM